MTIGVLTTAQKPSIRSRARSLGVIGVRRCDRWACGEATGSPSRWARSMLTRSSRRCTACMRKVLSCCSSGARARTAGAVGAQTGGASRQRVSDLRGLGLHHRQLAVDLVETVGHEPRLRLRAGRHLAEAGPAHRVAPRGPHRRVALVARARRVRARRRAGPACRAPEAAVVAHPRGVLVDDDRLPVPFLLAARSPVRRRGRSRRRGSPDPRSGGPGPRREDLRDAAHGRHDAARATAARW